PPHGDAGQAAAAPRPFCLRPPPRPSPPGPRRWTGRPAAPRWWPTWGGPSGTGRRLAGTTGAPRLWAFSPPTISAFSPPAAPPASRFPPPAPAGPSPTHWPRAAALDYRRRQPACRVGHLRPSLFRRET